MVNREQAVRLWGKHHLVVRLHPRASQTAQSIGASGQSAIHQIHSAWGSLAQLPLKAGSAVVAISSRAEIELKEVNVYPHLEEEKERDAGTWVLDIGVTNHMSRCQAAFTSLDTAVLGTMHFGDNFVARIEGHGCIMLTSSQDCILPFPICLWNWLIWGRLLCLCLRYLLHRKNGWHITNG
jgi:hypothetical protein